MIAKNIDKSIENLIQELGEDYNILDYAYNAKEFIPGESPVFYSGMYWDNREVKAAIESILIGKWFSAGEKVKEFEAAFAKKIHQLFGVMVNSGSSANLIMIAALMKYYNWQAGDEIIVSVVGFPTTVSAIVQNNLQPVFIDIEDDTLNFDITQIESKITPYTKAIFLSPVLGNPPNIDDIIYLCEKYNLKLILDCCDSLGTEWKSKQLGEYAVASSHSFYPAHTISTGEGGMITTDIREIANIARSLITWGRACVCSGIENLLPNGICNHRFDKWLKEYDGIIDHKYVFENMGYNLKPLDLQGAIGLVQINKLDEILQRRRRSRTYITRIFYHHMSYVRAPDSLAHSSTAWFGTPFICETKEQKQNLIKYLESKKIQTRNYFAGNILMHKGYSWLGNHKDYPCADIIFDRVFFVGASPHYDEKVFTYINDILGEFKDGQ
jgi:CDP-4-dehydro-6-deoxyglucose reductase, E1